MNTPGEWRSQAGARVALVSPGGLGAELARHLVDRGVEVVSPLAGRSAASVARAKDAGIADAGTLEQAVEAADIVLSLVPPASALAVARAVAAALDVVGAAPLYIDGNSISPGTAIEVAAVVTAAGARFVDVSVIGPTPRSIATTRLYASGPAVAELADFGRATGLEVRPLGEEIGRASALKMAYSSLSKGVPAISVGLLLVAGSMGVYDELLAELEVSQAESLRAMSASLARVPAYAGRWVGEAEEIARTFEAVGLSPRLFEGVADIYRFAAASALAAELHGTIDHERTMTSLVESLAAGLGS